MLSHFHTLLPFFPCTHQAGHPLVPVSSSPRPQKVRDFLFCWLHPANCTLKRFFFSVPFSNDRPPQPMSSLIFHPLYCLFVSYRGRFIVVPHVRSKTTCPLFSSESGLSPPRRSFLAVRGVGSPSTSFFPHSLPRGAYFSFFFFFFFFDFPFRIVRLFSGSSLVA